VGCGCSKRPPAARHPAGFYDRLVILPDVLGPGLRVVFCGTAAGAASARAGAYYAGPGNRFWPILHATGLTPRLLAPAEFPLLAGWGIGLTDVCKTASGSDREIAVAAFDPTRLRTALDAARPDLVAFTSKTAARRALGLTDAAPLAYGPAAAGFGLTPAWVLPSPSGAARAHWDPAPWHALAAVVASGAVTQNGMSSPLQTGSS
jgi:TDG/mug DNA glycosylase family protein